MASEAVWAAAALEHRAQGGALSGRRALVTGGGRGIGAAIAGGEVA